MIVFNGEFINRTVLASVKYLNFMDKLLEFGNYSVDACAIQLLGKSPKLRQRNQMS